MEFQLSEEMNILKETTKKFVDKELIPFTREIEESKVIPGECVKKIREMGFFGITTPEDYGGMGLGILAHCIIQEELGRAHSCFNLLISGNNGIGALGILNDGTEEQKKRFLPLIASGEKLAAFGLTEPNAGSDAASIQTTAVEKGDVFVLNGMKHFITRGNIADIFTIMAVTDKEKRARGGITAFVVEKNAPGFSIGRVHDTMGSDVVCQSELIFEDCEVPKENVLGKVGDGFKVAMKVLSEGRLSLGARSVGIAQQCLDLSVEYAKERVQFGKPIAKNQAIQWMLADMAVDIMAARSMLYQVAWRRDQGENVDVESSKVKLFASEMATRAADSAIQIHGGMGYTRELPLESFYREARSMKIVEGTSEIQRLIIARSLLS